MSLKKIVLLLLQMGSSLFQVGMLRLVELAEEWTQSPSVTHGLATGPHPISPFVDTKLP